ncbi:MAG: preprotein translocase subunit YajC [Phycisphaerales bacterium]|jgi:preprotein translocase subunit YajC|nr:preprotein translocase subunit YajC [Phycisphaerales bacterium]
MKTVRTLMLVFIVAISLSGLTAMVQAQDTTKAPADPPAPAAAAAADAPAPAAADAPTTPAVTEGPAITADDNVTGDESKGSAPSGDGKNATSQPAAPKSPLGDNTLLYYGMGAMVLMFIIMGRPKRKAEKKRKEMLSQLKKGDKVTTIGGIMGTVLEVRDDEVTIKIDEGSNTRMRFARWAVRGVGVDAKTDEPDDKK